ncbi:putative Ig domain-containing protein [Pseudomonas protegens]|uniref:putative Ig domain-containing protein n=1 Tax=Pseudomonas protegens TaxID=380021 RepID=UPI001E4E95EC|nr:putative Ig domain-containing protein [Pseudomonas protegens]MCD9570212.1 putative Ig domain-containing protein [Pseudomonas protegens]
MKTSRSSFHAWLARPLAFLFLLLSLTLAAQAQAAGPVITSPATGTALPSVAVGQSMSIPITSSGGILPLDQWFQCDIDDPSYDGVTPCLPNGLILDSSPNSASTTLHGAPTAAGNYTFSISLTDRNGTAGVATYTLLVTSAAPPTLTSVSPNNGTTAGATGVTLSGTNLTGATAVSFGGTPATAFSVSNATTITATTPAHAAGAVNVVVTTPGGTATLTNGYTYNIPPPTVGPVSATVAANSSANPITLSLSGGAASSVAVATAASHGTATASGTSITYTPTAGYSGSDSFTYTATNASGTSSPATVTLTVSAPTLAITPTTLPDGIQGTTYNQTVTATGGTTPYTYAISAGSLPAGLSLNTSSGVISGTPTVSGTFNLTVTVTDANSATGSRAYTLQMNALPPVANAVSATVAANSSANPITLNITGGAASSVAIATAASHGTATASGTSITYTPTAGYSGSDSFTYTATNASGTSSPATVTITVSAPSITLAPGSLSNGSIGTAYHQTVTATGGTAPYTYAITAGSLPAGLILNTATGAISGTPMASGTLNLTITATDANSATGSQAYSITIGVQAPVANAVSATVAANSSANPITLNITGGAASSVAIATAASHGTATASGTSITYTPTAGYSGSDSFTYTATNASGTSSPATVSLSVSAPALSITPASLSNGTQGSAYSLALSTSGGTAPYTYSISSGALPAGLSLNTGTGVISGTPSASGNSNLTITSTDSHGASGSQAYTLLINGLPPVANAVSATVAANSSSNPITLNLSGGAATSVAVSSAAAHGTATASGTSITYTPTAGYSGSDTFAYTATNANGTSSPATVTLTVSAPSLSITPASFSNGTVGTAYSVTLSSSGGTAPYAYSISSGALPAGLSLNTGTGVISGTPSASGSSNLTITSTDNLGATGSQAYSLLINGLAPVANAVSATVAANSSANPITLSLGGGAATSVAVSSAAAHGAATASGTSITYTPTAGYSGSDSFTYTATNAVGTSSPATVTLTISAPSLSINPATLGAGTSGTAYSATLSSSGGTAPYTYSISSGSLPAGLTLNASSGVISGTPSASGTSNLTITSTDSNGASGSRAYSISISAVPISVPASSQILAAGQEATVDLTQGATGGPFTHATLGSVTPASAGRVMMRGPFSMRFVPSAAFAGTAIVNFSLYNGSGSSAASTVSFIIQARPDPSKDAEVIGLLNAQSRTAERFASTQMDNFNHRLEQLHQMRCDRNSFNASLRKDGSDVPLGEMAKAIEQQLGNSAAQTPQQKREAAAAAEQGECQQEALAFWSDGFVNTGSTHARGARNSSFTTMGLSAGADYRLSPTAIAGVGIGYGTDRSEIGEHKTRSDADAIGIATYLSLNPASQFYLDGLLGYNRISFDSRRYITGSANDYARGSRDADQLFASLTASYEYRQGPLSLTPYGRFNASTTRLDAFRESGGGIFGLSYEEQRQQNFTSYLGVRSGYDLMTRVGVVTPKVGLAWGHNFSDSSDYKMRYTDQSDEGILYRLKPDAQDSDFASLDMGVDFNLGRAWQLGFSYKTALGSDERNDSFRLGLNGKF